MNRRIKAIIAACLLVILIGLGAYAAYRLYLSQSAYVQGDRAYEEIASRVITREISSDTRDEPEGETADNSDEIDDTSVDFDALRSVNADAAAWLYCPGTDIDYPVVAAEDYTYYLTHLPDGTYNINGSLFLDYNSSPDFSDKLSVIYGHNMKSGKMFGTLTKYKNQSYYDEHPYFYLYTDTGNYRVALLYGAVVSAERWTDGKYYVNADSLLTYAKNHTTFLSTEKYSDEDRLLVLSTCSYEYDNARFIVVGVLQPMEAAN